jgi:hypothetical protein
VFLHCTYALQAPSATCIRTVENLIKEAVLDDFQDKYKVNLAPEHVFSQCQVLVFASCTAIYASSRKLLIRKPL